MKDCLNIKIKGASSNSELPDYKPGIKSFTVNNTGSSAKNVTLAYSIAQSDDTVVKIYNEQGTLVSTTTIVPSNNVFSVPANTKYKFELNNIEKLRYIDLPNDDVALNVDVLTESFNDTTYSNSITAYGINISGSLNTFSGKNMAAVKISNTAITGNVNVISSNKITALFVNGSNSLTGDFIDVLKNCYIAGKTEGTLRIYCTSATQGFKVKMNGNDIGGVNDYTVTFSSTGFVVKQTGGTTTLITGVYSEGQWTIS